MRSLRKRLTPRLLVVYALAAAILWLARPTWISILVGIVPIAAGEGLRLWATGFLHKNDALTTAGPYAYVRHPLYLGTLLVAMGFAIIANSLPSTLLFAGFVAAYFGYYMPYKDRIEGARLEALYGDAFRRYAVAVPRLVPRFTPYVPLRADGGGGMEWDRVRFSDNHELGMAMVIAAGVLAMVVRWALA
jgi:protein-S-isoprenylcysteine O-methyltransferase Ste14